MASEDGHVVYVVGFDDLLGSGIAKYASDVDWWARAAGQPRTAIEVVHERTLDLCFQEGVTSHMSSVSERYVWPIAIYGIASDVACPKAVTLRSGESVAMVASGRLRRDLPQGIAELISSTSVDCQERSTQRNCKFARLILKKSVVIQPAAN